jgi:flagellar basal body-associated protein FliL
MEDEFETPPPSAIKKLLPLAGVLILGLGGGFGASLAMGSGASGSEVASEAARGEEAPAHGEESAAAHGAVSAAGHGAAPSEPGEAAAKGAATSSTITSLGRFTVNLRGSGGGRILQMEVALEADPTAGGTLEALTPRLRDSINTAVSDYTWTELEGTDGKTRLKDELLSRINGVADPVVVHAVYLTSFVVS